MFLAGSPWMIRRGRLCAVSDGADSGLAIPSLPELDCGNAGDCAISTVSTRTTETSLLSEAALLLETLPLLIPDSALMGCELLRAAGCMGVVVTG